MILLDLYRYIQFQNFLLGMNNDCDVHSFSAGVDIRLSC
jgi:hypothetical protein